jgi:phosphoenolpyruvate carboxylase
LARACAGCGSLPFRPNGGITPELKEALTDNVLIEFSGIATLRLLAMAYLAAFKPV